jgi:hypothetical protein
VSVARPRSVSAHSRSQYMRASSSCRPVSGIPPARLLRDNLGVVSEESSSPDLTELNRRASESAVRGDFDAAMSSYGPDSVWDTSPLGMGTLPGRRDDSQGLRRVVRPLRGV